MSGAYKERSGAEDAVPAARAALTATANSANPMTAEDLSRVPEHVVIHDRGLALRGG